MSEESEAILFEKKGTAGWISISRPERMNALSPQSMRAMWTKMAAAEGDAEIRVLVFAGRGEAFCAGMDMAGLEDAHPLTARRRSRELQMLTNRIAECMLPTIAAVNGVAMGAGLEICLACDLVIASEIARFAFPETRLGMIPCGGGTQRLARLIGLRRARDMIYSGRVLEAEQAVEWGLVNEAVAAEELVSSVENMVDRLGMSGRTAIYQAKRCINHAMDVSLSRGLEYETECLTTCFASGEPSTALRRIAGPGTDTEAAASTPALLTEGADGAGEEDAGGTEGTTATEDDTGEAAGEENAEAEPEEDDIFE